MELVERSLIIKEKEGSDETNLEQVLVGGFFAQSPSPKN